MEEGRNDELEWNGGLPPSQAGFTHRWHASTVLKEPVQQRMARDVHGVQGRREFLLVLDFHRMYT